MTHPREQGPAEFLEHIREHYADSKWYVPGTTEEDADLPKPGSQAYARSRTYLADFASEVVETQRSDTADSSPSLDSLVSTYVDRLTPFMDSPLPTSFLIGTLPTGIPNAVAVECPGGGFLAVINEGLLFFLLDGFRAIISNIDLIDEVIAPPPADVYSLAELRFVKELISGLREGRLPDDKNAMALKIGADRLRRYAEQHKSPELKRFADYSGAFESVFPELAGGGPPGNSVRFAKLPTPSAAWYLSCIARCYVFSNTKPFGLNLSDEHLELAILLSEFAQMFVIGHELGHLQAGHLDPTAKTVDGPGDSRTLAALREQEFEADRIAAHLVISFAHAKQAETPYGDWSELVAAAILGLFALLEIIEKMSDAGVSQHDHPPAAHRKEKMIEALKRHPLLVNKTRISEGTIWQKLDDVFDEIDRAVRHQCLRPPNEIFLWAMVSAQSDPSGATEASVRGALERSFMEVKDVEPTLAERTSQAEMETRFRQLALNSRGFRDEERWHRLIREWEKFLTQDIVRSSPRVFEMSRMVLGCSYLSLYRLSKVDAHASRSAFLLRSSLPPRDTRGTGYDASSTWAQAHYSLGRLHFFRCIRSGSDSDLACAIRHLKLALEREPALGKLAGECWQQLAEAHLRRASSVSRGDDYSAAQECYRRAATAYRQAEQERKAESVEAMLVVLSHPE